MSKEYRNSFTFLYLHTPFALARNIYVASTTRTIISKILETKYNKIVKNGGNSFTFIFLTS
jgi:hypothetical protein